MEGGGNSVVVTHELIHCRSGSRPTFLTQEICRLYDISRRKSRKLLAVLALLAVVAERDGRNEIANFRASDHHAR
jgi:hypothetical protein